MLPSVALQTHREAIRRIAPPVDCVLSAAAFTVKSADAID